MIKGMMELKFFKKVEKRFYCSTVAPIEVAILFCLSLGQKR
jgi:hypothetical protein